MAGAHAGTENEKKKGTNIRPEYVFQQNITIQERNKDLFNPLAFFGFTLLLGS